MLGALGLAAPKAHVAARTIKTKPTHTLHCLTIFAISTSYETVFL
jgi:hypothetical protein